MTPRDFSACCLIESDSLRSSALHTITSDWQTDGSLQLSILTTTLVQFVCATKNILRKWDKQELESGAAVGFPRGYLIFQAQQRLMALLRKIVEQLVEGLDVNSNAGSDLWTQMSLDGFTPANSVTHWSPFLNQPFSPAPVFDINKLISLAQAQVDDSEDHLWVILSCTYYRYL